jgi:hypothetical protein
MVQHVKINVIEYKQWRIKRNHDHGDAKRPLKKRATSRHDKKLWRNSNIHNIMRAMFDKHRANIELMLELEMKGIQIAEVKLPLLVDYSILLVSWDKQFKRKGFSLNFQRSLLRLLNNFRACGKEEHVGCGGVCYKNLLATWQPTRKAKWQGCQ